METIWKNNIFYILTQKIVFEQQINIFEHGINFCNSISAVVDFPTPLGPITKISFFI